jgi:hypothetical protein
MFRLDANYSQPEWSEALFEKIYAERTRAQGWHYAFRRICGLPSMAASLTA